VTQFIDLRTQYARIQEDVERAVIRVLRSGQYILGPEVEALEKRLAEFVGTKHAISCASGTDALVIALMAKGIGSGDAVITTPFTFMASAEAIAVVGATPVFVDIDEKSFNIDPQAVAKALTALRSGSADEHPLPRIGDNALASLTCRGIIPVDLFGLPADYDAINPVAEANGLFVIEDAAQSFGGALNNRRAGSLAEIACTSFFPAKPLGCYGDGGAMFTDDDELAQLFRSIRVHGQGADKYDNVRLGITGRLDAVQAAVLNVKMDIFEDEIAERQRVASTYIHYLAKSGLDLALPLVPERSLSAWAQFSVVARNGAERERLQARLAEAKIPTMVYYPKPLHLQQAYANLGYRRGDFPVSEDIASRIFSLPMHPYLTGQQVEAIVAAMKG
jgi:UDP-2-acetamido-2-deoxy-ribo-hexuluronate aminotransferase